jgi:8-oxo-dGTP pyrophosphatase MutT (NUDIX family)
MEKVLKKEKSCGCIIVNEGKVLLIYEKNRNFWGFPKGHVEGNETEEETAKREVKEEVNLDVDIDTFKRYEMNYIIRDEIDKKVVLFMAKPIGKVDVKKQESEIEDAKWCTPKEAMNLLTFDNNKELFKKVLKENKI